MLPDTGSHMAALVQAAKEADENQDPSKSGQNITQAPQNKEGLQKMGVALSEQSPKIVESTRQTIPGSGLEVASEKNPQIAQEVLPEGGRGEIYIPKADQKPTTPPPGLPADNSPVNIATQPASMPIVGQSPIGPIFVAGQSGPSSYDSHTSPVEGKPLDPVAQAASQPGWWDQVKDIAGKTGRSMLEILSDFAAGYSGKTSMTEQRLQREHELRMQGNQQMFQKDYLNMQQGFQSQMKDIDTKYNQQELALQQQIATSSDTNQKTQLSQQLEQMTGQHQTEMMNANTQRMEAENALFYANLNYKIQAANQGGADSFLSTRTQSVK